MAEVNYIKKFREDAGLTHKGASELIGTSKQNYEQTEKRWPNITLRNLTKVAKAFGYKVNISVVGESSNQE